MAKVFLIQASRRDFDLRPAEKYGEIVKVLGERESPSLAPGPTLVKLRQMVQTYDPATDFLLTAGGDPLAAMMVGMLLQDEGKSASWLRWNRNRDFDGRRDQLAGDYVPVQFDLQGMKRGVWDE